jgi:hypothetical protein
VFGDSEGTKADIDDAKDLLEGASWLEDKSRKSEEVRAYLDWLRLRTKNKFQKQPFWRAVLDALTNALLENETVEYNTCTKIIDDVIQAQVNPALIKVKKKIRGER